MLGNRSQCHSGNHAGASRGSWKQLHTERDKSRLEMAEVCGFWEVAASQSKMIGHSDLIKLAVFCGTAGIQFRLKECRHLVANREWPKV